MTDSPQPKSDLCQSALDLYHGGRLDEACRLLDKVLLESPSVAEARLLRGVIKAKGSEWERANDDLEVALRSDPKNYECLTWLGLVRQKLGRQDEAIELLELAVETDSTQVAAFNNLGMCFLSMRKIDCAIEAFRQVVARSPTSGPAYSNLGLALRLGEKRRLALAAFKDAVKFAPENPTNFTIMADQCARMGLWPEAIQCLEEGRVRHPKWLPILLALASAYGEVHNAGKAEELFQLGLTYDPGASQAYAQWLQDQGRFDEAVQMLQRCAKAYPRQGLAYMALTEAKEFQVEGQSIGDRVSELLSGSQIAPMSQMYLNYALARSREHEERFEEAMVAFDRANETAFRIYNRGRPFDYTVGRSITDRTKRLYSEQEFARVAWAGSDSNSPIFIVGMIRSGTTLLDQILTSHSLVRSAGETVFWMEESDSLAALWAKGVDVDDVANLAHRYLTLLGVDGDDRRVTDKMPLNYLHLGAIHVTFPAAKIIHIRRNPVDTCLSIYATHFGSGPNFAYKKENIVFYYREYMRLMEHWRAVLPAETYIEIDYENLVGNREETTRSIIEFCELPWDPACLHHEENSAPINSPSRWQARQPIYKSSIDRWKRYEPWLGAFSDLKDIARHQHRITK